MGDGMSDAYTESRRWEQAMKEAKEAEDEALESQEYKDLAAAQATLIHLIKLQLTKLVEVRHARIEYLRNMGFGKGVYHDYEDLLSELDASRGKEKISKWALRDLIK